MVSAVANTRLISAQYALKNLQSPEEASSQNSAGASSSLSSMLGNYGLDSDSASLLSNKALANLLGLSPQNAAADTAPATGDVTSASFMAALKKQLQDAADAEGTSGKAHDMLASLKAGTLTVYDPTQGASVTAWDVDAPAEKDTKTKPGKAIDVGGWSDFLDKHLERGSNGTFTRENGSYVDKAKDTSAYFGQIGSDYYYLTWPQPGAAAVTPAVTPAVVAQ